MIRRIAARRLPPRRHGARRRRPARSPRGGSRTATWSRPTCSATARRRTSRPGASTSTSACCVEAVGAEPAVWIGHSFGGRLAFEVAARHPELVERLVLLDPAILIDPEIALLVAEKDRRDRSYASFEEGVERRFVESLLDPHLEGARGRGSAGVPRRGRRRPLALPLQPGVGDRRVRRDGLAAAAVRGRPHPDPARARRGLLRHLRPPDRRRIARRSATCCRRSPFPAGTRVLWDALDETAAAISVVSCAA